MWLDKVRVRDGDGVRVKGKPAAGDG